MIDVISFCAGAALVAVLIVTARMMLADRRERIAERADRARHDTRRAGNDH